MTHLALIDELAEIVGRSHVLTDAALRTGYETDWTGRFHGEALAVARPGTAQEVASVLAACHRKHVPVVVQGGNTGLVGGGIPRNGDVVVSLTRLDEVGTPDLATGVIAAGAGATLGAVQRAARDAGAEIGLDMGSRDAATIGGIVATDAGGARALRYGTARNQVRGLEVVMADGTRARRMDGLLKDNAGLDWPSVVIGSEGTLGVVTEVLLQLRPRLDHRVTALVALPDVATAVALTGTLRQEVPSLDACDFLTAATFAAVLRHRRRTGPLRDDACIYLLIECADTEDPTDQLAWALEHHDLGEDVAIADDTTGRLALWDLREAAPEVGAALGPVTKIDVGVPLGHLERFLGDVEVLIAAAGDAACGLLFGHLGDGNVHVNVVGAREPERLESDVCRLAATCGGTISAEHGVGRAKAPLLGLVRDAADIRQMRAVKAALDPHHILGAGVGGLDVDTRSRNATRHTINNLRLEPHAY